MILYLFAHQDDELLLLPTIHSKLNEDYKIIFLTDGAFYGSNPIDRNNESLKVLKSVGVLGKYVVFLNQIFPIQDTKLVEKLEFCINQLTTLLSESNITEIYLPSWEGGHPDHDSTFLIGLELAKRFNLETIYQFSLYNSFNMPLKFFRVMNPVNNDFPIIEKKISLIFGIKISFLCRFYKTQWKTWLGLFPFIFYQFIILRKSIIQKINCNLKLTRPHIGKLYYEKRNWITFDEFKNLSRKYYEK